MAVPGLASNFFGFALTMDLSDQLILTALSDLFHNILQSQSQVTLSIKSASLAISLKLNLYS